MRNNKNLFFILIYVTVMFPSALYCDSLQVSDSCKISLLTCTPGNELYSCFGHSGIRIKDSYNNVDLVFNYGTFDFNKPYFYVNFCRGILIYSLGVDYFEDFKHVYIYEERGISEQQLNLTTTEKQKITDYLINNASPENRDYRYDFLLDNCATRIRDVFQIALGEKLSFQLSDWDTTKTFRNLIDEYSLEKRWENFGMNLLIGLPVDKATTPMEQMFLPDYLSKGFENAFVTRDGVKEQLVSGTKILLNRPYQAKANDFKTPEIILSVIAFIALILSIIELKSNVNFKSIDFIILFATGFMGLLFLSLWFLTQHWTTAANLNLLWALPTNLYLAFSNLKKHHSSLFKKVIFYSLIIEILFLMGHAMLPQPFQLGMVLINAIIISRLAPMYIRSNKLNYN